MTVTDPTSKQSEPFMLLRLPLEIRRKIYGSSLLNSPSPSAETIYLSRLPDDWRDPPSPLLLVNSQVHDEVIELLQPCPITLRVTHQGSHFDSLAETCFIAQRRSRDYSKISHLRIDIWPPHPDRPVDMIDIWRHLRKLRTKLRAVPLLKQVSFVFRDNEIATWTLDGKPINLLNSSTAAFSMLADDDVTSIMDLFARVSAAKATFHMPHGLALGETTEYVRNFLRATNAMMMGRMTIDEDVYNEKDEEQAKFQDYMDEDCECSLEYQGAKIARDKLDAMTFDRMRLLSYSEWDDFVQTWSPKLWRLDYKKFKDEEWMELYVKEHDGYESDDMW